MTVLPFPVPEPDWRPPYYLHVLLTKGSQRRLYEILGGGLTDHVQTWVRFNGRPHRAQLCETPHDVEQIAAQFQREIAALIADGWILPE